ncbi:MAG: polysaccharide deacetylase family protein [Verrucomicrobiales bacterium]|jgi:peptidoglycan/xylan/chitin deacetylase (PgdA/CDA1 family)|nr:polysaccharide deacetylase family protein [Verrucomicrobiales bacterium]
MSKLNLLPAALLAACATTPPQPGPTRGPAAPSPNYSYHHVRTTEPVVALTFDDGPSATHTPRLLQILREQGVRATFFVVGTNVAARPDLVRQAAADGHELGNHSWSHPRLPDLTDAAVTAELRKTADALAAVGVKPAYLRPPYGAFTNAQRQWVHQKFGYDFIFWDVDPNDWQRPGVAVVTQRVVDNARPGSIILLHDVHADTVTAVPAIIAQLRARGFRFLTVSELLAAGK